jgi:hypothetical protein
MQRNQPSHGLLGGKDSLGRTLPQRLEAPAARSNRYVGIFYFLWLGQHGTDGPYDNTQILRQAPEAAHDPNHPLWGPQNAFHFWGEPLYGYYFNDDPWVLRRHMQLLTNAGVDFLVFDTTNAVTYKNVYDVLFPIMEEMLDQGWNVPRFVFYTNTKSGETIRSIYEDVYKPGRFRRLWFAWKGRPLIIGNPDECSEEIRRFFTFRLNQWPNEPYKTNGFPWIEFVRPQRVFYNDEGEKEIISVSVAQHPSIAMSDTPFYGYGNNWGRNYHDGANDDSPGAICHGYNIAEQWEFALKEDPQIVFITGWNEWIAMRLKGVPERPNLFVDQATREFSRDIEPMKGGYDDNYYLQMIQYIRRFKGLEAPPAASAPKTIRLDGDFAQWLDVTPEYRDFAGDTAPRRHGGYGGVVYEDETGRNDLVRMKVARDQEYVYFYAETAEAITPHTGKNWMLLLIGTDDDTLPNWEGYSFVVNRNVISGNETTLERSTGGWNWERVASVSYRVEDNKLHLAIPRKLLGVDDPAKPLRLRFKWADHMQEDGQFMDFYLHGDTAPDGRLFYIYEEV